MLAIAAMSLLATVALITLDVIFRQLGLGSVPMLRDVITAYLVPVIVFLSLPIIQQKRRHIQVDTLFNLVGMRSQRFLLVLAWVVTLLLIGGWTVHVLMEAIAMQAVGERITGDEALRIWPARFLMFAGLAATLVVVVCHHPFRNEIEPRS